MPLVALRQIYLSFGGPALLEGVDMTIEPGERVCLLGRNGEGKSTLMRVIAGELKPDDGERAVAQGVRIARLTQEVPDGLDGSVFEVVTEGLGDLAALIQRYHHAGLELAETGGHDRRALERLNRAQHELEAADGWQLEQRVETVISRMALAADAEFSELSGGTKRRVLLARALTGEPDLLLLDEPTNHLDIEAIDWLESFLAAWNGTLVFVTHDRAFMQRLATRIFELDRGRIAEFPGDYDNYLRRRAELDHAEARANARFDKILAQEEVWIRQGIKARRTRNEGRVRQLEAMRETYQARRLRQGAARIELNAAERSGKLVCEACDVSYAWKGVPLVREFSTTILRGDRIGVIGPNGCGKTTLLNLLLGRIRPDRGRVDLGTKLEVAYFDQLRSQLVEDATVLDNLAGGSDKVTVNGKARHVVGYLQDFLFPPSRCRQPVRSLSGGERNRLLLAKLFARPANVLVLDEPTNDLDVETLELLEELLLGFDGTLLLVSHDRAFLDNVVTSTLVFEGDGLVRAYVGGYTDWQRQRSPVVSAAPAAKAGRTGKPDPKARSGAQNPKLSYKDQRELDGLPRRIEELEQTLDELQQALGDPQRYRDAPQTIADLRARMLETETALEQAFARWEALEGRAG